MILDRLSHASVYSSLHPAFPAAFAFLARPDLSTLPDGRLDLDGARLYALVQTYATQPVAGGCLECHRRYLDIQFLLSGEEAIGYAPLEAAGRVVTAYDADRDIAFLDGAASLITLRAGDFAVLYPHDAHLPGRCIQQPAVVRKVVVKVAID